ncbi:MAG TPA: hypothetical protein VGM37_16655 [Armatimonadota bacterium]|jgi:hypothetical protein
MPRIRTQVNQLRELTVHRRMDAEVLFRNQRWNGSVYLVGYSVECAVKPAVSRGLRSKRLPDELAVHDLGVLIGRTSRTGVPHIALWSLMNSGGRSGPAAAFGRIAAIWSSEMRYETRSVDKETARAMLADATKVTDWLNEQYAGEHL